MCRSTSISSRRRSRARSSGSPSRRAPARRQPAVDRLGLVGHALPGEALARAAHALAEPAQQLRLAAEPLELGGEHVDVAGLEAQAEVAVAEQLLVGGQPRAHRHRAGAERAHDQPGRGRLAERGGDDDVGVGEHLVLGRLLGGDHADAVAHAAAQRARRRRAGRREHGRPPVDVVGRGGAARAGTAAARRAPPARRRRSAAVRPPRRRRAARGRPPPRPGAAAGSSAGNECSISSRVASKAAVRASSRPKNSSTKRRATWVESTRSVGAWKEPTFSAREWRSATDDVLGANGSCTWTKSSGAMPSTSSTVRPTSTGGDGRLAAAVERQQLADAEHAHAAVGVEQVLGALARGADQPPRVAHQLGRARRREHEHAVAARRPARPTARRRTR